MYMLVTLGTKRLSRLKNTFSNTRTVHILRKMYQKNHVYMTAFLATIYI